MSKLDVRAAWAWQTTEYVLSTTIEKKDRDRYGTLARKLPSYLQSNGLGQTLAFLYSKAEAGDPKVQGGQGRDNAEQLMLELLGGWLLGDKGRSVGPGDKAAPPRKSPHAVMGWVTSLDALGYRTASHEARECALWLRRFAEGRTEGVEE